MDIVIFTDAILLATSSDTLYQIIDWRDFIFSKLSYIMKQFLTNSIENTKSIKFFESEYDDVVQLLGEVKRNQRRMHLKPLQSLKTKSKLFSQIHKLISAYNSSLKSKQAAATGKQILSSIRQSIHNALKQLRNEHKHFVAQTKHVMTGGAVPLDVSGRTYKYDDRDKASDLV
jgi:uncharacterized protein (UPF0303 family)